MRNRIPNPVAAKIAKALLAGETWKVISNWKGKKVEFRTADDRLAAEIRKIFGGHVA